MGRPWAFVGILAVGIGAGYLAFRTAQDSPWQHLVVARERGLWMRHMPMIEGFIHRELDSSLRVGFPGVPTAGFRENVSFAHGVLLNRGQKVGTIDLTFLFDETRIDPRSVDLRVDLSPQAVAKVRANKNELASIFEATKVGQSVRTTFCGMETFITRTADRGCHVRFKCPLPSPFIPIIADYDRGDADSFEFDVVPRYLRFLIREGCLEEYPQLYRYLPTFNPPPSVLRSGLGATGGVILIDGGGSLAWTLDISGQSGVLGKTRNRTVQLRLSSWVPSAGSQARLPEVFKPRFLAKFTGSAPVVDGPVSFSGYADSSQAPDLFVSAPYEYAIEKHRL